MTMASKRAATFSDVFSPLEEAFFQMGDALATQAPEQFDDTDDGGRPPSFWQRLLGRRRR